MRKAALALTSLVLVTGCYWEPEPEPMPEKYLSHVYENIDGSTVLSDETWLGHGQEICSAFDSGATVADMREKFASTEDGGQLIFAAGWYLCPEHRETLQIPDAP